MFVEIHRGWIVRTTDGNGGCHKRIEPPLGEEEKRAVDYNSPWAWLGMSRQGETKSGTAVKWWGDYLCNRSTVFYIHLQCRRCVLSSSCSPADSHSIVTGQDYMNGRTATDGINRQGEQSTVCIAIYV